MYSQIQGIYFSHTAILSGPSFSESLATDTAPSSSSSKDGRTAGETIDDFNSAFNSAGGGKKDYVVFLSFRGEDTRNIFTGHLYEALTNAGINTFIDNEELPRGETINKELERAIEGSRTSIVVFSRNYADSTWCLEELSKIMDCRRTLGQLVFPVFYGVDPSEVRKQTGNFGKALMRHEARFLRSDSDVKKEELDPWRLALWRLALFYVKWKLAHTKANVNRWKLALAQVMLKQEWDKWKLALFQAMLNREMNRWKFRLNGATLRRWKSALTEAANLSGWDSSVIRNDAKLIKVIVNDILRRTLSTTNLHVAPHPVGMYFRVQKLRSLLKLGLDDHEVRFVGISGMAGVGKTTIAKAMYNVFHSQFGNNRSFLENVRHNWDQPHCQVRLQKQLLSPILKKKVDWVDSGDKGIQVIKDTISGKRVLVVLDDVDHREQLDALTGSCDWFGPGSIIIITTRNQQLLKELNVDATYMAPEMNEIESLELFCWHAFGGKRPNAEYIELSKSVVNYCGGQPLALRVLGSYFKGMSSKAMWISELEKLKKIPRKDILSE